MLDTLSWRVAQIFVFVLQIFISGFAFPSNSIECPDEFVATVTKVFNENEAMISETPLDRIYVYFQVEQKIKGNVDDVVVLKILKHGPISFSEGSKYRLFLRNGFLCDAMLMN